jgi:CRP-like cAMP-binding protein
VFGGVQSRWRIAATIGRVSAIPDNLLLAGLPPSSRDALLLCAERVTLDARQPLYDEGERVTHAYFPIDCSITLAARDSADQALTIGTVGFEGMLGIGLVLDSPVMEFCAEVQAAGHAWRVDATPFARLLAEQPQLHARMNRYVYVRLMQMAQDISCRNSHLLEGRLACQLLMARDRARSNRVALTHEALARLLGVRRAGVTLSASAMQKRSLVRYARGDIQVLDLAALRAVSCACYSADRRIYARFLGKGRSPE